MYKFNILDKISLILILIGALNWGLIGLFNFNIVALLLGEPVNLPGRIVYILIGLAGLNTIFSIIKMKKSCK